MKAIKAHPHFGAVLKIYQRIESSGFQALLAGGCVRDGLLGRMPNDFDIATSAKPEEITALFSKTIEVGKAFGTIIVVEEEIEIEVTTFRTDGLYQDGRRPTAVEFSTPEEDAKRRDFTVNALFYDISKDQVLDFVGGAEDLKAEILRAVGDPAQRFREDHLRLLRAVRFVGQLGFELEPLTRKAVQESVAAVASVSRERIHQEMTKLIGSENRIQALREFVELGFSEVLFEGRKLQLDPWISQEMKAHSGQHDKILNWFLLLNAVGGITPLESWLSQWRFSNEEKQGILKMMSWTVHPEAFAQKPLGELAELYFDHWNRCALNIARRQSLIDAGKLVLVKQIYDHHAGQKPEALIKAKDLPVTLKGAALGQALKEGFWAQLESKFTTVEAGLQFLKLKNKL